jgi:hypothetical protein
MAVAEVPTFLTKKLFAERHPAFNIGSLNWILFHRESNGLQESGAVVKLGRRLLIDEEKFFDWVREQNSE